MNNYAPVLIITLNRDLHFRNCIDSLSACIDADKTDLYIALDYPAKDSHWEGYLKISKYLDCIKGFKSISVIKRNENYGAQRNLFDALSHIFKENDRLIITEDDNVFAPSFLKFINTGLSTYEHRPDIFAVSGYNMPDPIPAWYSFDVYLIQGYTAWGVGIWRDKFNKVDWSIDNYNSMLFKKENFIKLKKHYQLYLPGLLKLKDTGIFTDGFLFLYLLDKNMYSVYPVKSRVRNNGHDGSGEHGGHSNIYLNQMIYEGYENAYFPHDLQPDNNLLELILKNYQLTTFQKVKRMIPEKTRIRLRTLLQKTKYSTPGK